MSINDYSGLDLSHEGPLAQALFAAASREAAQASIPVSGEYNADDSRPPFLSPAMQLWYRRVVSSVRGTALSEVRNSFGSIDLGKGQFGFLLESERDRIERKKFTEIDKEREQYFSNAKVRQLAGELQEAKYSYEQMKAENGGDDANEWPLKVYVVALTVLAFPELPLNFESFSKFPVITPAIAAALVLIVAGGIGWSSHIFGTTIKQWGDLFGGHVSKRDKMKAWRYLSLGGTLFVIAMSIITTGRSLLFQEDIQRKIVIGEPLTFADYMAFGFSVGGNILIWALGVAVAYVAHSHIPGFGAKQREVKRLQSAVTAIYERDLQHRRDRHISKAQQELGNLGQLEVRQSRVQPHYQAARAVFENLRRVDNQVLAILEEYRAKLVEHARATGAEFLLDDINSLSDDKRTRIDASSYELLKLRLPYA